MKKLLAILLTLAMLVPMCGFAEESAPQATLTTITFRDFNGRALMAEMEEAAETAYRDLLDALRVEVYRQGFTSCELFLNDQSIVDYGVQTRGADVYISGDVLGGTVYLNLDEDMRHIAEILHQWNASQSVYADAGVELPAKEVSESIAQEYENVGALLAKITKNPLITGEMQPEDVANGLFEADWQQAATRLNKILKVTRVESVSNPPEGCESAKNILYFPLSNEQLMEVLCILLDTVEETPAVKAYVDLLNTYRQLVAFAHAGSARRGYGLADVAASADAAGGRCAGGAVCGFVDAPAAGGDQLQGCADLYADAGAGYAAERSNHGEFPSDRRRRAAGLAAGNGGQGHEWSAEDGGQRRNSGADYVG